MKTVDNYTMSELIEKYKPYMGSKIYKIFEMYFPKDQLQKARRNIDEELKSLDVEPFSLKHAQMKEKGYYELLLKSLESDDVINKNNEEKLVILSKIYKECAEKLKKKELDELRTLILAGKEYAVMTFTGVKDVYDYEIITREEPQSLSKIRDKELNELLEIALEVASAEDFKMMIQSKFQDTKLFDFLMNKLLFDFFIKQKKLSYEEFTSAREDDTLREEFNELYDEEFAAFYKDYFKENMQFFDRTDLLLNTVARIILGLRRHKGEDIEGIYVERFGEDEEEFRDESIDIIRNISRELDKSKYTDTDYCVMNDDGEPIVTVNRKLIKEFLSQCTKDQYFTTEELEQIHRDITRGEFPEDNEVCKIANIDKHDLINASKSYETREDDDELKNKTLECAIKIASYLKQEQSITDKEIVELYMKGLINIDVIKNIDIEEIPLEYYDNEFKNLYSSFLYLPEEEIEERNRIKETLQKISALYKELEKKDKLDSDELILDLIISHGEDNSGEILSDLNSFGLADTNQCFNHAGINYAINLYRKGTFMPAKLREAFDLGHISDKDILQLIGEMSSNEMKYMSICAIFPGENEEDTDYRNYLVSESVNIANSIVLKGNKKRIPGDWKPKSDEYITDPYARLSLFRELDRDYSLDITDDGYAIVTCPNSQKVIIEKMLDKEGNPFYGAATYVLDQNYFELYENDIYINRTIVRQELTRNSMLDEVTPIRHWRDKWGEDIKELFDVKAQEKEEDKPSKYTEEEIAKINEAIARVERSRIKRF